MEKVRTHDVIAERRNASIQPVVESQRVSDIMRERMARGGHCEHNTIYRETTTQPNDITEISGNDEFHSANQITWPKYVSVCAQRMNGKNTLKNHEWVGRNRFFFFSPFPFTFLQNETQFFVSNIRWHFFLYPISVLRFLMSVQPARRRALFSTIVFALVVKERKREVDGLFVPFLLTSFLSYNYILVQKWWHFYSTSFVHVSESYQKWSTDDLGVALPSHSNAPKKFNFSAWL